jgi:hypothetical protein
VRALILVVEQLVLARVQKSNFKIRSSLLFLLLPLTERSFCNDSVEKIKSPVFDFGRAVDIVNGFT